jgi:enterochelin esterase family protein
VTAHQYDSKSLGKRREINVYTPPGYEQEPARKYPVLILLPAEMDSRDTWVAFGKVDRILDNQIAAGHAVPMVVLLVDGHPLGLADLKAKVPGKRDEAIAAFQRDLFEDALPFLEASYRVKSDAPNRAIAGMSCGFGQSLTLTTGLLNLDRLAWIGALAADQPPAELVKPVLDDAAGTKAKLRLLYLPIGKNDFLLKVNQTFSEKLTAHGIPNEWQLTEGGHSWAMYRGYLADFVGKIFRDQSQ